MTNSQAPDPPTTLVLIHRAISRGLEVGQRHTQSFARDGYPDPATGEGFGLYLRTLAGVLHIHHSAEDEIAFPFLRERFPDLPLDDLIEEHGQMASILEEVAPVAAQLHGQAREGPALEAAHGALARLADIWPSHIDVEESSTSMKRLQAVVGAEELTRWLQEMGQHRPADAPPDALVMPFILHNLSAEDRAIMAQNIPPIVSQELVPKAWKEIWAPMKPFLLD